MFDQLDVGDMKFIYLADSHIGGSDSAGYCQQERSLRYARDIFDELRHWLHEHPEVDFMIHGGDMADSGTGANILQAKEFFAALPCPCFLALGNHDLTETDSLQKWLQIVPEFFPEQQTDYSFLQGDVRFDILTVHWGKQEFFWDPSEAQIPWFSDQQFNQLQKGLCGKRRILITHAPPCGLPEAQTGLQNPLHPPAGNFETILQQLAEEYSLDLILGAHNHMNLATRRDPAWLVTSSAFSETPFEFKLFEINDKKLCMETISLVNQLPFRSSYDHQKSYVQGRPCDRKFSENHPQTNISSTQNSILL